MTINSGIASYQSTLASMQGSSNKAVNEVSEDTTSETTTTAAATTTANTDTFELSNDAQLRSMADTIIQEASTAKLTNFTSLLDGMLSKQSDSSSASSNYMSSTSTMSATQAAYNISDEGDYGVSAVADRLMNMAMAMAGDDPEMMETMKEAVIKGFEAAGLEFDKDGNATGLPQVSIDTFTEVMQRFDYAIENNNSLEGYQYDSSQYYAS